jgi:hypothetical protein
MCDVLAPALAARGFNTPTLGRNGAAKAPGYAGVCGNEAMRETNGPAVVVRQLRKAQLNRPRHRSETYATRDGSRTQVGVRVNGSQFGFSCAWCWSLN